MPEEDARWSAIETLADGAIELASGEMIVGDASGNGNAVAITGDLTISNAGVTAIGASKVTSAMLVDGTVAEADLVVPTADGKNVMRMLRANLDCTASSCVIGTVSMVQTLPANAVIYQSWWVVEEQFVDAGSGTVAIHCEDANNIFTAADITGDAVGAIVAGNATGVIATMTAGIASGCTITATIATIEQTAGIMNFFLMYAVHD